MTRRKLLAALGTAHAATPPASPPSAIGTDLLTEFDIVNPVSLYGAKGNGVDDDTAAIQQALDTGKTVYLPRGAYRVTSTLLFKKSGSRFIGEGTYSLLALCVLGRRVRLLLH